MAKKKCQRCERIRMVLTVVIVVTMSAVLYLDQAKY